MIAKHAQMFAVGLLLGSAAVCALTTSSALAQQPPLTKEEEAKRREQQQQQQQQQQPQRSPDAQRPAGQPPNVNRESRPPNTQPPQRPAQRPEPPVRTVPPQVQPKPVLTNPQPSILNPRPGTGSAPNNPSAGPPKPTLNTPPPAIQNQQRQTTEPPRIPPKQVLTPPPQRPAVDANPRVQPGAGSPATIIGAPRALQPGTTRPIAVAPVVGPAKLEAVKQGRVERTDGRGRKIIEEPGNRTIIRQDNRVFVHRDESKHIQTFYPNARASRLPGGLTQTVYVRPDGVRVFSEVDGSGRLVRRYGRDPRGREINYLDNRRFYRNLAIGVGIGAVGIGLALALSPPVHALPRNQYIVDYDRASDDDLYLTLTAPPVMRLERAYSLEEVRYSQPLRERMRRIDLDTITFDFGAFTVSEDQYVKLERVARAIGRAIEKNPAEMFLIEGHTDAVGAPDDNLSLSDRRAEAVARVLTEHFSIPMENLVTQGYGEQHLKVETREAERANRRVALRRISPLLGQNN